MIPIEGPLCSDSYHQDPEDSRIEPRDRILELEAEVEVWKLEAALWQGAQGVELPEGWERIGEHWYEFQRRVSVAATINGKIKATHPKAPLIANVVIGLFDTWADAMKAAQKAAKTGK